MATEKFHLSIEVIQGGRKMVVWHGKWIGSFKAGG
jgi:hypothetical protein